MISYSTGLVTKLLGTATAVDADHTIDVNSPNGLRGLMAKGVIRVYSGAQPTSSDAATTGLLLGEITVAGATYTVADGTNGLSMAAPSVRTLSKASEVWTLKGSAAGTAGWWRYIGFLTTGDAGGASTTHVRIDGSCGVSSGDLRLTSVTIAIGSTATIDTFTITVAA